MAPAGAENIREKYCTFFIHSIQMFNNLYEDWAGQQ